MELKRKKNLAIIALILAAFTWGSAFCVIKGAVDAFPPIWLLAYRFSLAAILLFLICMPRLKQMNKKTVLHGAWMGIILYFEFWFFTVGIQYTSGSKSAFIVASYIIILPLIYWGIHRKRPRKMEVLAAAVCMGGLACILLGSFDGINKGDVITMLSSLCYAVHIVYTGIYAKDGEGMLLNLMQIGTGAILAIGFAVLFGGAAPADVAVSAYGSIVYLSIFCTIIPYLLSVFGQKYVKTSTSGILLSFESVFGCLCSVVVYGDKLSLRFVFGALLVVLAFFICNKEE